MNNLENKTKVINSTVHNGVKFEVIEYSKLNGANNIESAMSLFFAEQSGLKMKQVRIKLDSGAVKTEAGALYYYKGIIQSKSNLGGVTGFVKKALSGTVTNESTVKPVYFGTGEINLQPSYKHYMMLKLNNESIIVDKGMFFCCSETVDVKVVTQKNISSTIFGSEGFFQIELSGSGVVVLECDVPQDEIIECNISADEELKVDGNFVIARTKGVDFSVTKSDKSLIKSAMNGEGLLNTFSGYGKVWIAPTKPMYNAFSQRTSFNNNSMNNQE